MEKEDLTLLILAGGMGSRYGGLKQIEPVGPNKEFIIDYSIYDAIKAGFNKVVFIIKKENYDIFKETIGKRVEDKIKTEYVFQELDNLPENYTVPEERQKPWGTAHAIGCASNIINEPFMIINADDFYGSDAYKKMSEFLKNTKDNNYCIAGYQINNTLTNNGEVKRGVCKIDENFYLKEIIESNVKEENGIITAKPLNGNPSFTLKEDVLVSMNMIGFTPSIFKYIKDNFPLFLEANKKDLSTCEYLIPDLLEKITDQKLVTTKVIMTSSKWEGITYKEDLKDVIDSINKRIESGEYPQKLWE